MRVSFVGFFDNFGSGKSKFYNLEQIHSQSNITIGFSLCNGIRNYFGKDF